MNISPETFNEFLATVSHVSDWENARPGMWVRSQKTDGWVETPVAEDVYKTLPIAVGITPKGNSNEAMLLMYGWMTPLDDDGEHDGERLRVRIILYFNNGDQRVVTQVRGEVINDSHDGVGEGAIPEMLNNLRMLQEIGEL